MACEPSEASQPAPPAPQAERRTVVVELYSSLACDSCRELEQLLADVGANQRVVPLDFHVQRHDASGWRDPYATAAWTARERALAPASGAGATVVVDGVVVEARPDEVRAAIAHAQATAPAARAQVRAFERDGRVVVTVSATLEAALASRGHELWLVVTESSLVTPIPAGPRAGQVARNDHVVRRLVPLGPLGAGQRQVLAAEVAVDRDPAWIGPLAVAAVVRDAASGQVVAASRQRL
jgi:hypothetical protein